MRMLINKLLLLPEEKNLLKNLLGKERPLINVNIIKLVV